MIFGALQVTKVLSTEEAKRAIEGSGKDFGKSSSGAISYPEPSLSGSGHTGLKNDPDWSIHKLLDPYPLWRSRARPI